MSLLLLTRYGMTRAAGGGGGGFSPTDIADLDVWLDASDASTLTLVDTNRVATWTSKDAGAKTFSSGAQRPTVGVNTLNSLNTIAFGHPTNIAQPLISSLASSNWKYLHDGTAYTLFAVMKFGIVASPNTAYYGWGTGSSPFSNRFAAYWDDGTPSANLAFYIHNGGGFGASVVFAGKSNDNFPGNTFALLSGQLDPSNATAANRAIARRNGSLAFQDNTNTGTPATGDPATTLYIGSTSGGAYLVGDIAEFIIYKAQLSAGDLGDVETYLIGKWGL